MEGEEKLRSSYYSLISSLGIKTLEEKIAFKQVSSNFMPDFFVIN